MKLEIIFKERNDIDKKMVYRVADNITIPEGMEEYTFTLGNFTATVKPSHFGNIINIRQRNLRLSDFI